MNASVAGQIGSEAGYSTAWPRQLTALAFAAGAILALFSADAADMAAKGQPQLIRSLLSHQCHNCFSLAPK